MQLCSTELRAVYLVALAIWALLSVCESGLALSKQPPFGFLRVLQPHFLRIIAIEIQLILFKSHIETAIMFFSPLLWLPCGLCAPLYPLMVLQIVRLKYVVSEFTRQSFNEFD
jgi:hypothetical protein